MDRQIKAIKRDKAGDIVAVCNPSERWSPRRVSDVARDIRNNAWSYYVQEAGRRTYVRLLAGSVLETTKDTESKNSLTSLPSV